MCEAIALQRGNVMTLDRIWTYIGGFLLMLFASSGVALFLRRSNNVALQEALNTYKELHLAALAKLEAKESEFAAKYADVLAQVRVLESSLQTVKNDNEAIRKLNITLQLEVADRDRTIAGLNGKVETLQDQVKELERKLKSIA